MSRTAWLKLSIILAPLPLVLYLCQPEIPSMRHASKVSGGRGPAAVDSAAEVEIPKVELDRTLLAQVDSSSSQSSFKAGSGELLVPQGARLMAIVDNDCLEQKYESGGSGTSLSEKAYELSDKEGPETLKTQAYSYSVPQAVKLQDLVNEAHEDSCVRHVTNDRVIRYKLPKPTIETHAVATTNDPQATTQAHLPFIKAGNAWDVLYGSGRAITSDVVIAVIDSGVDYNHPDLKANMWRNSDDSVGYDFVSSDSDPMDDLDHGTHVAGLAAATANNGIGVTGVMGQRVKIMAIKVIDANDEGTLSDLINGIRWATDKGADVINLSLGGPTSSTAEADAIRYATSRGVAVVVAAGNDNKQLTASDNDFPAGYSPDVQGMIAVGALDSTNGRRTDYSNYSPNYVYIAAPGSEDSAAQRGLLSTLPQDKYGRMEGTSMACPVVAGAAALIVGVMKSEGIPRSSTAVIEALTASARNDSSLATFFRNGAVLDLERLTQYLKWRYIIKSDAGSEGP